MARSYNGFGPNPISHSEILAWSQLYNARLTGWELSVIRRLDILYMQHAYNKDEHQVKAMDGKELADSLRAMARDKGGVGR
jgi:hypothetical protein